ncbi:F-box/kelch-repeat protein At1g74510 [Rosa chinensis]|uniref:F-box/kelch-repeat protein At1g74510 n=1 Tax=Rosa chinensis TaxID=74649 RepID=UPI000D08718A|nr:F-box/kelch-repeat protein At1g74510 [Rosa chinensis]XP_024170926.1 F-box/kelch-repeat protein At1g74510 [Rosa chinensis]XP_024170927.1 F-box/kelch-repeat protein At1g74510 [Rosa chinensis]XP_024170929.1 F-box/kelch-repeat protein At1g74510 [Rosa chinensis]XP_024170930.1 F-box/kelch-repeat protein At1g74510 [Rosa chinensis]XP_024170931.1 F-box/kelch-repeat protein At1g74510 [Rosa chinensis]XP_040366883.1 F-box/kelch-repeat protein At1g74510 [Rosa chinensis]
MLEGPSYLVSRQLPSSCEQESQWMYNTQRVLDFSNSKRPLEDGEDVALRKACKHADAIDRVEAVMDNLALSHTKSDQPNDQNPALSHANCDHPNDQNLAPSNAQSDLPNDQSLADSQAQSDQPNDQNPAVSHANCDQPDDQNLAPFHSQSDQPNDQSLAHSQAESDQPNAQNLALSDANSDQPNDQNQDGNNNDPTSLFHQLGRDVSINCLLRCSRADYGSVAMLCRSFRSLIRTGELYTLRRRMGIVEHWAYFSCALSEWWAFNPDRRHWMPLPKMEINGCFMCSDKESVAVGTELLVFGKEIMSHVVYKYSLLTHSWSSGRLMNTPRCLFASASSGEIAILAGGCDPCGNILSTAELYNSETGTWLTLPSMNKPRKMCSGVFMDGKLYVIGGIGVGSPNALSCGEVYDLERGTWTEIPNMHPRKNGGAGATDMPATAEAPPLLAVVNNKLYAADYAEQEVRKYDKERKVWVTIGRLPERTSSMNGWGVAFRACGNRLIVIGGPRGSSVGQIEVNSWVPDEGPPQWNLLAIKDRGGFVYNCAVMGC